MPWRTLHERVPKEEVEKRYETCESTSHCADQAACPQLQIEKDLEIDHPPESY